MTLVGANELRALQQSSNADDAVTPKQQGDVTPRGHEGMTPKRETTPTNGGEVVKTSLRIPTPMHPRLVNLLAPSRDSLQSLVIVLLEGVLDGRYEDALDRLPKRSKRAYAK